MTLVHRVLAPRPVNSLGEHVDRGGGRGIQAALAAEPEALIAEVEASGLRGRGGAGFPTGVKWRTVAENRSSALPTTVVVNGAEGEPGTFKDRTIIRTDPYPVIEGALIAARAVGSAHIVVALKKAFAREVERIRSVIAEVHEAGWADGVELEVFEGPGEYLYGEETALLETIAGRKPFPRISPPFRRGVLDLVQTPSDALSDSGLSAPVEMAGPEGDSPAPPTLVDNVETLANVPAIVARGAAWFRTQGTEKSPGTIVCTVTGRVRHHGVGEVMMGTPLREVIQDIGGGPLPGRRIKAVMSGVATGLVTEDLLDTPVTYEDMTEAGSGLGSAGFMVFDDTVDMTAVAAGASRFLAIESCGQCTPCKQDGLALAELWAKLCRGEGEPHDLEELAKRSITVGDRARCYLALQHQALASSVLERFADDVRAHVEGDAVPVELELVAELVDIADGAARLDEEHRDKQPDWSFGDEYSGKSPADLFAEHRADDETARSPGPGR
ncbi:MAG TPA: NADH-ubiquinone oxidoreductase-F iron-sulfur binding region domain-containing protein [Acidimicrobiales bacterium]|nr:NADH-ubiquinone oxidoreductase-F iron-sulfur binding region domain-containing protein [Acidimicrobiales bacterium]